MTASDRPAGHSRRLLPALAAAAALALASCSGPPRPKLSPVQGSATFRGRPAARAVVVFRPAAGADRGLKDRLPHAEVGADGRFRLGTYAAADGAPPGDYVVTVTWPVARRDPVTGDEAVEDRLRARFSVPQQSPLKVTVKEGDNTIEPFRLD